MALPHFVTRAGRTPLIACASAAALLAVFRSIAFVAWPHAAFDADQAIVGLMAKHLSEGRALPVTYYGQNYMLAVQAYLAAPLFLVGGATVTLLKLPLLAINAMVAALLVVILVRDVGLRPLHALLASSFFSLCAPIAGVLLVAAMGGSVEPYLYAMLIWITRRRLVLCGVIAGIGFLHREFSVFALAALLLVEGTRAWPDWRTFTGKAAAIAVAFATVVALGNAATWWGDMYGPDLPRFEPSSRASNVEAVAARAQCAKEQFGQNLSYLFRENLPMLAGTKARDANQFWIGNATPATPWVWIVLVAALAAALLRAASIAWTSRTAPPLFVVFLAVTGGLTLLAFTGGCDVRGPMLVRYTLLGLLIPVAIAAWHLRIEPRRAARAAAVVVLVAWMAWSGFQATVILRGYMQQPPTSTNLALGEELLRRNFRLGRADYWTAHPVTFLTGERLRLASEPLRILTYEIALDRAERVVWIQRDPCAGGEEIARVWVCP